MIEVRTGLGWDTHRLAAERALILGGVTIPSELGLEGHSDADILSHAITDALLGAAALGDIGMHSRIPIRAGKAHPAAAFWRTRRHWCASAAFAS